MMKRYLIENVKCDITDGGIACGPVSGSVIVTVQFKDGDETKWISNAEAMGIPNFYLLDKDVHADLVKEDMEDLEFAEYLQDHFISELNGIELGEYDEIFESISEDPKNPAVPLIRYIIAVTRCDMDETADLIAMALGKFVDELDIPVSDVEEDYIYENQDPEEESD